MASRILSVGLTLTHFIVSMLFLFCSIHCNAQQNDPCLDDDAENCNPSGSCEYCEVCENDDCRCESAEECQRIGLIVAGVIGGLVAACCLVAAFVAILKCVKKRDLKVRVNAEQRKYEAHVQASALQTEAQTQTQPSTAQSNNVVYVVQAAPPSTQMSQPVNREGDAPPSYDNVVAMEGSGVTYS